MDGTWYPNLTKLRAVDLEGLSGVGKWILPVLIEVGFDVAAKVLS